MSLGSTDCCRSHLIGDSACRVGMHTTPVFRPFIGPSTIKAHITPSGIFRTDTAGRSARRRRSGPSARRWTRGGPWPPSSGWQRARSPRCTGEAVLSAGCSPGRAVRPLVERGTLGGLQFGDAEAVGDRARHIEGDRKFRSERVFNAGGVVGQEVADGRADGPAAVRGAYVGGLRGRHRGVAPALAALDIGGAQSVVGQFALEPSWPVMLSPRADGGVAEQGVKTGSPPRTDAAGGGRPDMQALWAFLNGPVSPGRNPGPWRLRAAWGLMMPNCLGRPITPSASVHHSSLTRPHAICTGYQASSHSHERLSRRVRRRRRHPGQRSRSHAGFPRRLACTLNQGFSALDGARSRYSRFTTAEPGFHLPCLVGSPAASAMACAPHGGACGQ